ncbi:hypothetical protein [Novosphingobium cyanobacteriorum]|uniref:Lipoprotein n=1 Tax=Novosphingobium cyanobacteriorum TaxID=3024215 RepID=A0ABT6CLR7_9SPHN|nr:hypothetical protein [Novosphingobium cyanobacteriorum]MDF8334005.1 hypothetical protein [Novosphingobium cyanobacteriorum]
MEKTTSLVRPVRTIGLPLLAIAALALGGCGDSGKTAELEQRLVAVEAKADSAEKRAKAAESFAQRGAPQPFPAEDANVGPPEVDQDAASVTDDSANDPSFDNDLDPPPAPEVHSNDG